MKRAMLLTSCLLVIALVCACGGGGTPAAGATTTAAATTAVGATTAGATAATTTAAGTTAAAAATTAGSAADSGFPEGLTFTYWGPIAASAKERIPDFSQNLAYMEKAKITGVQIEFIHPTPGQEADEFALMIAADDLPDMIQQAQRYKGGIEKAIADGAYVDITGMIEQHAPNYMGIINSNPDIRKEIYSDSGIIQGFGMVSSDNAGDDWTVNRENPWSGPMIRTDWLDELGLDVPQTVEDWTEALTLMKEKYDPEIVLSVETKGFTVVNGTFLTAYGIAPDFYQKDGQVLWGFNQPELKGYLELMHDWYSKGLIDPDFTTRTGQDIEAVGLRGQLGARMQQGLTYMKTLEAEGIFVKGAPYPKLNDTSDDIHWTFRNDLVRGEWGVVTKACEEPEYAVQWFDWNYSEEGANIINFGPKGVTYDEKNEIGAPVFFEAYAPPNWMPNIEVFRLNNGPYLKSDYRSNPTRWMDVNDYRVMWDEQQKAHDDYHLSPYTLTAEEGAESATIMSEAETYRDEMVIKFILGTEPLTNFDAYLENMERLNIARACEIRAAAVARFAER